MGYILDLRKIEGVGHRPLQMVAADVILFDAQGRVLLEKRTDDGTYCVPGGSMELGETPEEAAKRELFEETGLIAKELHFINVEAGEQCHFIYPNGDEVYAVDINYFCDSYEGTMKNQEGEVDGLKFYSVGELPVDLWERDRIIIENIWKERGLL
ncbi:MAG: NUDIX domain-containing protein [Lachnospiraceae bacterium]|nr:NUDIX domain-containing protein [Lachnospiraceae bacterium]